MRFWCGGRIVWKFDAGAFPHLRRHRPSANPFAAIDLVSHPSLTALACAAALHQAILPEGNRPILHRVGDLCWIRAPCVWQMHEVRPSVSMSE
jgi:hypothetical protein